MQLKLIYLQYEEAVKGREIFESKVSRQFSLFLIVKIAVLVYAG